MPVRKSSAELATELDYLRSLRKGRGKKPITKAQFNTAAGRIKRQFEALEAEVSTLKAVNRLLAKGDMERAAKAEAKAVKAAAKKAARKPPFCDTMNAWLSSLKRQDIGQWKTYEPFFPQINALFNGDPQGREQSISVLLYYGKIDGKTVTSMLYGSVPTWLIGLLPTDIEIFSNKDGKHPEYDEVYFNTWTLLDAADPSLSRHSYSEPQYIKIYDHGEVPRDPGTEMADEPVGDGYQLIPSHPNLDPSKVVQSQTLDCLPRGLVEHLKPSWDADKALGKTPLTQEFILQAIGKTSSFVSFRDCEPFFMKYRLHITSLDVNGRTVYEFKPKTKNGHIRGTIFFLQHNSHVTLLNHNLTSLARQGEGLKEKRCRKPQTVEATDFGELEALMYSGAPQSIYYKGAFEEIWAFATELGLEGTLKLADKHKPTGLVFHMPERVTISFADVSLKSMTLMRESVFQPQYESHYSESVRRVFNDLKRSQLIARFTDCGEERFRKIDRVRSYTANFRDIDAFPVFDYSELHSFDGEVRESMIYLVAGCSDIEGWMIANQTQNIVSGLVILRSGLHFNILGQIRPSSWETNTVRDTLKGLFQNPNDPDLKLVANVAYGLAAQLTSQKREGIHTTSLVEAFRVYEGLEGNKKIVKNWQGLGGYLTTRKGDRVEMEKGYFGVAFMVLDIQRLRNLEMYRDLRDAGFTVHGISTDCMYVSGDGHIPLHEGVKTWESLGRYRADGDGVAPLIPMGIRKRTTTAVITHERVLEPVSEIYGNTWTTGIIPGSGKSYGQMKHFGVLLSDEEREPDVLIVCPSQEQVADVRSKTRNCDVITYAKFLGRIYDEENKVSKVTSNHDLTTYKGIILEELCQIVPRDFLAVLHHCKSTKVQILGNGDVDQILLGELPSAYSSRTEFYERNLPRIFDSIQIISGSRRLKGVDAARDCERLESMKEEFQMGMTNEECVAKYFEGQTFTDVAFANGKVCINYTNLAGMLRPCGTVRLKFKGYDKAKLLVKNSVYDCEIAWHNEKQVVIVYGGAANGCWYPRSDFANPDASTGFGVQGKTITEPFCIFEYNHQHADWRWFLTCVARCEKLSDVWIYVGKNTTSKVNRDIAQKIGQHKRADYAAGRIYDEADFVTFKWVRDTLRKTNACCNKCGVRMALEYEPNDTQQWSINRRDNNLAHTMANCEITCLSCNHGYRPSTLKS